MNALRYSIRISLIVLVVWMMGFAPAVAQQVGDSTKMVRVETKDGNEFIGHITSTTETSIQISTEKYGVMTIPQANVKKVTEVEEKQIVDGKLWHRNLQDARYFWAPNGYGLAKGEGYYQNVWVLFNQVSYGFTNNFSCGVGIIPTFLFGASEVPVWITPKFSFPIIKEKLNLGVGTLFATVGGESFGLLYGTVTMGGRNSNLSVGLGYGYSGQDMSSVPLVHIGGLTRVGQNSYLMTENYFLTSDGETYGAVMLGGRQMIRKVGIDYGLMIPTNTGADSFVALPWLGLTISF